MNSPFRHAHLIGIGGIHVSAVAKLLLARGIPVSGSELAANEQTAELEARGVRIAYTQAAENIPTETDVVVFSSAAGEMNPERVEATRRGLPQYNSHQFLGLWGETMKQIVITGTHGKSTTTAMMALIAKEAGLQPTVVVGTKVAQLTEGNIEIGTSEWLIVEGDEFDYHFLSYRPTALLINNIEGDHFDVYPTLEAMIEAYRQLLERVVEGGWVIANDDDVHVRALLAQEQEGLRARNIKIHLVGLGTDTDVSFKERRIVQGRQELTLVSKECGDVALSLRVPGAMNAMNAAMCYAASECLKIETVATVRGLGAFTGVWRRLEKMVDTPELVVFSDYGHHPTAVQKTLEAVKECYPERRLVLCFQPHHRNRTKHLFLEFVPSFDVADVLVLVEIYDVAGREQAEDENVSSQDLCDAIRHHDADRGVKREVRFAKDGKEALHLLKGFKQAGDVMVVMGAGSIYTIAKQLIA